MRYCKSAILYSHFKFFVYGLLRFLLRVILWHFAIFTPFYSAFLMLFLGQKELFWGKKISNFRHKSTILTKLRKWHGKLSLQTTLKPIYYFVIFKTTLMSIQKMKLRYSLEILQIFRKIAKNGVDFLKISTLTPFYSGVNLQE